MNSPPADPTTDPHEPHDPYADGSAENRRNHYRVLHVQPEAPLEVIKASYRTLMSRLRMHPDLGGSHAQAAMINEAWAVLSDADSRAHYDRDLRRRAAPPHAPGTAAGGELARPEWRCLLCGHGTAAEPRGDSRCMRCNAPLATLPAAGSAAHELLGRRNAARRDQDHVAMLHIGWPSPALPVRWRDLSVTGLSFYAPQAIAPGRRVHLVDPVLEVVAEVVSSRPAGRVYTVHARLMTALPLQATGVFVSAQA